MVSAKNFLVKQEEEKTHVVYHGADTVDINNISLK